jgi:predicted dienelactone hydrolase
MNTRFSRLSVSVVLIVALALGLLPAVQAQEGPKPEAVGLRPDAPPYALHGPYWVGTLGLSHTLPDGRQTPVQVWYPALNPNGAEESISYVIAPDIAPDLVSFGHAIEQATPDADHGPYPLVVFAHGYNDIRLASTYLAEHLASWGFVVIAIDYADNWFTQDQPGLLLAGLYTRPKEISSQLDFAAELSAPGGQLEGMIDPELIAIVGHSWGGTNALTLAGGQLDLEWYSRLVAEHPEICIAPAEAGNLDLCGDILDHQQELAELAGLENTPEGLWPSWNDPRVDAIVGLAPDGALFGAQGLQGVKVPVMLSVGTADRYVNPDAAVVQTYRDLASVEKSLVVLEGADHHVYADNCTAKPVLAENFFWACSDPVWDMDRAHDLINHFTTAFLLATLKGNTEAAAALTPDAVSFPGITYETTGF